MSKLLMSANAKGNIKAAHAPTSASSAVLEVSKLWLSVAVVSPDVVAEYQSGAGDQ